MIPQHPTTIQLLQDYYVFDTYHQDKPFELIHSYLSRKMISEIQNVTRTYQTSPKRVEDLEKCEQEGKTILKTYPPRIMPVSFIVPHGDQSIIDQYCSILDRGERKAALMNNPTWIHIMENKIISDNEVEMNNNLGDYVVRSFERFITIECKRLLAKRGDTCAASFSFDVDTNVASTEEERQEKADFAQVRESLKKKIHEFYCRVAEIEVRNCRRGHPVFSRPQPPPTTREDVPTVVVEQKKRGNDSSIESNKRRALHRTDLENNA